ARRRKIATAVRPGHSEAATSAVTSHLSRSWDERKPPAHTCRDLCAGLPSSDSALINGYDPGIWSSASPHQTDGPKRLIKGRRKQERPARVSPAGRHECRAELHVGDVGLLGADRLGGLLQGGQLAVGQRGLDHLLHTGG